MKSRLISFPLQFLTVLALPLLIVLMGIAFGSVTLHQLAIRDLIAEQDIRAVRGAASDLSERLEQQAGILRSLAARAARGEAPASIADTWAETLFDNGVALYDADGDLLAASPRVSTWQPTSPLRADLLSALASVQSGSSAEYVPLIEPGQNATRIAIVVSAPVAPGDAALSAIGVISLDQLGLLTLLSPSESTLAALTTQDGVILYHSEPLMVGQVLENSPPISAALRGESGADSQTDSARRPVIVAFAPVAGPRWALIQQKRWTERISPLMRFSQAAPLVLLPGLAIAALAVWFGIRGIVRPLQKLEARAADLAAGNFDSMEQSVGGIEEIGRLQDSLSEMADQLQRAQEVMRHTIGAITQAQEEERRRLARELHDHMIQALIALDHRAQVLRRYLNDDPTGAVILTELRSMTAQAIDDLRRMIRAMRPIYLEDFGLVPALEVLAREMAAESSGECDIVFEKQGSPRRLTPEQEIALYRVAQEALNNARRHSHAQHIWLSVNFSSAEVVVTIRDDGAGFKAPRHAAELPQDGHFGLIGMFERAALIGAQLTLRSAQGTGTTVTIRV